MLADFPPIIYRYFSIQSNGHNLISSNFRDISWRYPEVTICKDSAWCRECWPTPVSGFYSRMVCPTTDSDDPVSVRGSPSEDASWTLSSGMIKTMISFHNHIVSHLTQLPPDESMDIFERLESSLHFISVFWISLLWGKEMEKSPDLPMSPHPVVLDPRELERSGNCSTWARRMMFDSMLFTDHSQRRTERKPDQRLPRSSDLSLPPEFR